MYNILLLGSTGFIGKNIIESFVGEKNYNLIVVTRDYDQITDDFFSNKSVTIKIGTLSDSSFIEKTIEEHNINVIIHLVSSLIPSSSDTEFYDSLNEVIVPTFKLIDFIAHKNIKFVYFSSGGTIYGNINSLVNESNQLNPINNYGFSKLLVENYIKYKTNSSNIDYVIIRPSNVYGKYQSFTGNQGFVSVAINKIHHGIPIEIWGDGNSTRDYVHVNDVVEILKKIISNSTSKVTINLSTGIGFSLIQIIEIIEKSLKKKAIVHFNNKRIIDADRVILNNSKLLEIIDHKFISVADGIKEQINYYITTIGNAKKISDSNPQLQ